MSSTVSYANVAAKGSEPTTNESTTSPDLDHIEKVASGEVEGANSAENEASGTAQSGAEKSTEENSAESSAGTASSGAATVATGAAATGAPAEAKPKKVLAPAPVPTKSAWGASSSSSSSSTPSSASVDESKWPTPDKVSVGGAPSVHPQKFIKPITNKWVPINAKVVLPSPKSASKTQNRNRKSKKTQPKKVGVINKRKGDEDEVADLTSAQEGVSTESNAANGADVTEVNGTSVTGASGQPAAQTAGSSAPSSAKNNRKFNGSAPFVPRFTPQGNGQIPAQQGQGNGQNGGQFYHPQPFNPNYYNQNRQFRPRGQAQGQNGFRPHHQQQRNFRPNGQGYPMDPNANGGVFIPQQVQIPPPISPKQDPQQALIQQIDYYFSLENLIRDIYLRKNMLEDGGWVPLLLILEFKRVKIIINGIQNSSEDKVDSSAVILDSLSKCGNLEVRYVNGKSQEDSKIEDVELRVKDNYEQWLLPQQ